jgi:hypothetical protein
MSSGNATSAEVFLYTGEGGTAVPHNVVRVRVDPSVTSISVEAFNERRMLTEVELCEGLVEIGFRSFCSRDHSITKINIPTSLRRINDWAFFDSLRTPIRLHDGIESIGEYAFASCIFTNFRVPSLITVIPERMFNWCKLMFSLELPEDVTEIGDYALANCCCLRNVAIPPNAVFDENIFKGPFDLTDLQRLFSSIAELISALQHRFDGLPIHRVVYYQSYNHGVLLILIAAINMRSGHRQTLRSKLDPTGNQQDCLGMTPLHILACSSVHNLEIYCVIVEKYPTNLITEDRWGALPLLYAFWGAAPAEIIQFLLDSYQSLYPDHVFNWTMMVETIGRCDTPMESIENLLLVKETYFPEQPINWDYLLDKFTQCPNFSFSGLPFQGRMRFFLLCGLSSRVEALAFKVWRDHITNMIHTASFDCYFDNSAILNRIQEKLSHYDDELHRLKEVTSILELTLWKMKMNEKSHQYMATRHKKKMKAVNSSIRSQSRVTCGADVVIGHVMPYLVIVVDEEPVSDSDDETVSVWN